MRRVVTAVNAAGRSCIASADEPLRLRQKPGSGGDEVVVSPLWAESHVTQEFAAKDVAADLPLHHECAPGESRWLFMSLQPNHNSPMHQTRTVDYDYLVSGALKLILEDGEFDLLPGDCAILPGVRHAWRAGAEGAEFMVVQIGLER